MIRLVTQTEATAQATHAGQVQNISPYSNPAHVLAPPRLWLEKLKEGDWTWAFFRWRYKSMLRQRAVEDAEAFFQLLLHSEGEQTLLLSCHCLSGDCHRELALEFLETLRAKPIYQRWKSRRIRPVGRTAHGAAELGGLGRSMPHPSMGASVANLLVAHPRAMHG